MRSAPAAPGEPYSLLRDREAGLITPEVAQRRLQFPEALALRLRCDAVLRGHDGCVNRLAWNAAGSLLASGSDDRRIMLWAFPAGDRPPLCVETHHQANIFGVAFLPGQGDAALVSGAMDFSVQLHRLDCSPLSSGRPPPPRPDLLGSGGRQRQAGPQPVNARTTVFNCHKGRVKAVEVEPGNPHNFWSASEDGTVRQFDTRCPRQDEWESPNVLLAARAKARPLDLLALAINKARPDQLAVGCSDPFVRIYDRRRLSTGGPESAAVVAEPALKLAPPHLCLQNPRKAPQSSVTHVSFGRRGDRLLAAYHADHAHAFDVAGAAADAASRSFRPPGGSSQAAQAEPPQPLLTRRGHMPDAPLAAGGSRGGGGAGALPAGAEDAKNEGNRAYFDGDADAAVWHYSRALERAPRSPLLLASRAAALLKRDWLGDAWAALRDAEAALAAEPGFAKAHARRAQALFALGQLQAARLAADRFATAFPAQAEEVQRLRTSIAEELRARAARAAGQQAGGGGSGSGQAAASSQGAPPPPPPPPRSEGSDDGSSSSADSEEGSALNDREGWLREDDPSSSGSGGSGSGSGSAELQWGDARIAGAVHWALQRYVGGCNVQTDIKEACFLGGSDELVAAGSDDGNVFIFNAATGRPLQALPADEDVANCVQPHPRLPLLATSGIESVVRLWQPGEAPPPLAAPLAATVGRNQERLKRGTSFFRTVPPRVLAALTHNPELLSMLLERAQPQAADPATGTSAAPPELTCRMH